MLHRVFNFYLFSLILLTLYLPSGYAEEGRTTDLLNASIMEAMEESHLDEALINIQQYYAHLENADITTLQPDLLYNEALIHMALDQNPLAVAKLKQLLIISDQDMEAKALLEESLDRIELRIYHENPETIFFRGESALYNYWRSMQNVYTTFIYHLFIVSWILFFVFTIILIHVKHEKWLNLFPIIITALFVACAITMALLVLQKNSRNIQFAVILENEELRTAPQMLGEPVKDYQFLEGLTVQVLETQGTWALIERSDNLKAWIPYEDLYPLRTYRPPTEETMSVDVGKTLP